MAILSLLTGSEPFRGELTGIPLHRHGIDLLESLDLP